MFTKIMDIVYQANFYIVQNFEKKILVRFDFK